MLRPPSSPLRPAPRSAPRPGLAGAAALAAAPTQEAGDVFEVSAGLQLPCRESRPGRVRNAPVGDPAPPSLDTGSHDVSTDVFGLTATVRP